MRLTSTYTPSASADIPVLIVCYGTRKVFMLKPQTYTELIAYIRQKFKIGDACGVSIETGALDVCRGFGVEIDENAWPVMRESLDEISVVVNSGSDSKLGLADNNVDPIPTGAPVKELQQEPQEVETEDVDEWMDDRSDDDQIAEEIPAGVYSGMKVESDEEEEFFLPRGSEIGLPEQTSAVTPENDKPEEVKETPVRPKRVISRRIFARIEPEERQPTPNTVRFEEPEEVRSATRVPSPEERFQVRVEGPEPDQHAEIKTRGKHLVKKVLAAVCKTFSLDYESASLYIVNDSVNEEGALQEHYTRCPSDWSMAKCGVTSRTNLRIQIEAPGTPAIAVMQRSK